MKAAKFRARDEATFGDSGEVIRGHDTPGRSSISPTSVTCNPESDRNNDVPRCGAVILDMRNQIPLCAPRVPAIAGAIPVGGNPIPHNDNAIPDNDNDLPVIAAWRAITPLFRAADSLLEIAGKRSASVGRCWAFRRLAQRVA